MTEYRKKTGKDVWHFCTNCSNWPTSSYTSRATKPTNDELCDQCLGKKANGNCS